MAEIRIAPAALEDLKEIKRYISEKLDNPSAAERVVRRIINKYSRLKYSPFIGSPLSKVIPVETDYRYIVSGNYIVFYKVDNEVISIYRILYGRRDYIKVLFGDISDNDEA